MKNIVKGAKAREALVAGIVEVAEAVEITLGPKGKNGALSYQFGAPTITNDGVSIAKEVQVEDPAISVGVEMAKEVAVKTNDTAGDGTTTSLTLLKALVKGYEKEELGLSPMGVRAGIEKATQAALAILDESVVKVKTPEELKHVATISAESESIGELIADTVHETGLHGVIAVEESSNFGIEKEIVEGMQFDRGFLSPYMATNQERREAIYENTLLLLIDKKLQSIDPLLKLLNQLKSDGIEGITIVATDMEQPAIGALVMNKLRGSFHGLAIKAPGYGAQVRENLEDLAVLTGATVISDENGVSIDKIEKKHLGKVGRIISKHDKTTFVGGKGSKEEIKKRVELIKEQLKNSESGFERERLQERLARLTGGVAVLRVGAATETEMKYLKLKVEDAVNATKAALESGIVAGGGIALFRAAQALRDPKEKMTSSEAYGYNIVLKALEAPLRRILANGDIDESVIEDVVKAGDKAGYDARAGKVVKDMVKAGIIDPVRVTRTALERSSSLAALVITTETLVAYVPERAEDKKS